MREHLVLELRMDVTGTVLANKFNASTYHMLKAKFKLFSLMTEEERSNVLDSIRFDVVSFRKTIIRSE